jgi:hypothetical protein
MAEAKPKGVKEFLMILRLPVHHSMRSRQHRGREDKNHCGQTRNALHRPLILKRRPALKQEAHRDGVRRGQQRL